MTAFDHEACEFFEKRCRERGIVPRPISVSRKPGVRRPDFAIQVGTKTVAVEVKALEPDNHAEQGESVLRDTSRDIRRISRKLRKANGQLRPFAERGIPGIVNITDYTRQGLFFIPDHIHSALFGGDALLLSVQRGQTYPPPPRITGRISAGRETLTPQDNTSISALLIFRYERSSHTFVSLLFHNRFARNPISPDCAADLVDYQYESREREWVAIEGSGAG